MRRKVLFSLLILVLILIWGQSFLPTDISRRESGSLFALLSPVLDLLFGPESVSHHLLRKIAHFTEFFLLGCLMAGLAPHTAKAQSIAGGLCLLAALIDETIQIFSDRGDQIQDVWLDFAGAAAGVLLINLLCRLLRHRKEKKPGR